MEIGTRHPFLSYPFAVYGQLAPESKCSSLWKFISEHKIHLEWDDFPLVPEQMVHDRFLTELFAQFTTEKLQLRALNRCRAHLQAYTLVDVTTCDGLQISKTAFDLRFDTSTPSKYIWPPQQLIPSDKSLWQTFITETFGEHRRLHTPMGLWCKEPHKQH
jgi:hypothetical protein